MKNIVVDIPPGLWFDGMGCVVMKNNEANDFVTRVDGWLTSYIKSNHRLNKNKVMTLYLEQHARAQFDNEEDAAMFKLMYL